MGVGMVRPAMGGRSNPAHDGAAGGRWGCGYEEAEMVDGRAMVGVLRTSKLAILERFEERSTGKGKTLLFCGEQSLKQGAE